MDQLPTHKQGNTLDLIITELAAEVQIEKMSIVAFIYLIIVSSLAHVAFQK